MTLKDSPAWIALTQGTIEARSRSCTPVRTEPVTREVASALLTVAVQREIAAGGRVEHASDTTAVLAHGARLNHVLHLLLSRVHLRVVVGRVGGARRDGRSVAGDAHRRPLRQRHEDPCSRGALNQGINRVRCSRTGPNIPGISSSTSRKLNHRTSASSSGSPTNTSVPSVGMHAR